MDNSDDDAIKCAPHNGEYVGTIEVVVLRCFPADSDTPPGTPRSNKTAKLSKEDEALSFSDEESETDGVNLESILDGKQEVKLVSTKPAETRPADTEPVDTPPASTKPANTRRMSAKTGNAKPAITRPASKPKSKPTSTQRAWVRIRKRPYGLDGAWDTDEEANDSPWNIPAQNNSITYRAGKRNKTSNSWDNPYSPDEEDNSDSLFGWEPPLSSRERETKTSASGSCKKTIIPKGEAKKDAVAVISANNGTWSSSGESANSSKSIVKRSGHGGRSYSRDSFGGDWNISHPQAGFERGRSRKPRSPAKRQYTLPFMSLSPISPHQNSPTMQIRGGGPGSYSVSSVHGEGTSPNVVININNIGPPPSRDWQSEGAKEMATSKSGGNPPPSNDPWTSDLPAYDPNQDPDVNVNGKQMPGAWGDTNDQDQGDSGWEGNKDLANSNADWACIGNNDNRNHGNNDWGNGDWKDTSNDDNQRNGDDWNTIGDGTNWNDNANDTDSNASKGDAKQNSDSWGSNDNDDQQNDDWKNNDNDKKDERKVTVGAKDPETLKLANNPWENPTHPSTKAGFSFGNSKAKGSTPGSAKSKASGKGHQKPPTFGNWMKPEPTNTSSPKAESKKAPSPKAASPKPILKTTPKVKTPSIPGAWSPPVLSPKAKTPPNTKAHTPFPKKAVSKPTLSISTAPKPKPYWSKWNEPDPVDQKISEVTEAANAAIQEILTEPIYSVPADLARRTSMSHQVRPGRPSGYHHRRGTPWYMDTFDEPYAVFVFNYRDTEVVEGLTGTTIIEPEGDEKQRYASLSKDEIIEEFMKVKKKLSNEVEESDKITFKSNPDGVPLGPDVAKLDERLKRLETSAGEDAVTGWLESTGENGGHEGGVWGVNDNDGATWGNGIDSGNSNKNAKKQGKGKGKANVNNADSSDANDNESGNWNRKGKGKGNASSNADGESSRKASGNSNSNSNSNGNGAAPKGAKDPNNRSNNTSKGGHKKKDVSDWSNNTQNGQKGKIDGNDWNTGGNDWSKNTNTTRSKKKDDNDWNTAGNDWNKKTSGGDTSGGWDDTNTGGGDSSWGNNAGGENDGW